MRLAARHRCRKLTIGIQNLHEIREKGYPEKYLGQGAEVPLIEVEFSQPIAEGSDQPECLRRHALEHPPQLRRR